MQRSPEKWIQSTRTTIVKNVLSTHEMHVYHILNERVLNPFPNQPCFLHVCLISLLKRAISLFPTAFSTRFDNFLPFSSNLKLKSANSFSWEESKVCRLGKG